MKCWYFGFVSPQLQVDMHARSRNTFIVLSYAFIWTLLAQWLLNDSLFQTPPLRDVICGDWLISFKAVFVALNAQKAALSGKEWICIFIQTNGKDQQVSGNTLMIDVDMKHLKTTRFNSYVYMDTFCFN